MEGKYHVNSSSLQAIADDCWCEDFAQLIQLIMDDEASESQKQRFMEHYNRCYECKEVYDIQQSLVEFVKQKIEKEPVPLSLVEDIRSQIYQLA